MEQAPGGMQDPATQVLVPEHEVPSGSGDQATASRTGRHLWHSSAGLMALAATKAPPMEHPGRQEPSAQTAPTPQARPSLFFRCRQLPAPSHRSRVQGLPSSAQRAPGGLAE